MSSSSNAKTGSGLRIVALIMLAVGLAIGGWGGFELERAMDSQRWPSTIGTVSLSTLQEVVHRKENETVVVYYPRIQYVYRVFGQAYTADRMAFGVASGISRGKAQQVLDDYPEGMDLTVYYDPDEPSIAVLKVGHVWSAYLTVAAGMVFCAGGMLGLRAWRRRQERQNIYLGK